ncbi:tetratricopeptide repeat-containing sensor histidine kinase [Polaribacter sp.]|uniref:tetratricopeptide repeat-containing sensor histidine kinase n=1 Tax=Polaribacter sp. TaxID=1920175 RepID=UPI00262FC3F3|nr:tetratricopeptide repeat-containing sensor histidine kinase [Polaribacter sp.]MDG1111532.1 histidine kinase [Polaribacter sp.]MDG1403038.1 histidine kinase [Polaribacter sp.]
MDNKVSFFVTQNIIDVDKDFLEIKQLYEAENFPKALRKGLDFLGKYANTSKKNISFYEVNNIIGDIYRKNNNHDKSIIYYKNSLKILIENNLHPLESKNTNFNKSKLINAYLRIGGGFLRKNLKDSAKYYYENAMDVEALDEKSLSYQASVSTNLSGLYMQDSLYDLAKNFAIKAVVIHKKRNNKVSQAAAKGNLASILLDQNNYKEAKRTYKEALDLIKNEKSDRALRVRQRLYYNLSYNLYKLKDYEAYNYQEQSYLLKDSLRSKEVAKIYEELRLKYDFDAEKEFLEQQQEVKLLEERDRFRTIIVIVGLILIALIVVIGYYNIRQKNLQLKLSRTELLQNQNLDKLKSEFQARALDATLNGRESERKEIAETLHDNVSALLSSANLHLQATKKQFTEGVPLEIDKTQEIIAEASQKIRDLSHTLVSSVLLKFGLNFAIRDIAEKYSNSELNIDTEIEGLRRYDQKFEIKTYNIIQEFVNNILKHSKAKNAIIKLKEEEDHILMQIFDDGIGFDQTQIVLKDGLGINQIEARIQIMKGKLEINSQKGKGTQIKVELPIKKKQVTNLF